MIWCGPQRFKTQETVSKNTDNTVIINATAGFGKTIIGLMWSMKSDKKLIWVCPRNDVATSVYRVISNELETLGIRKGITTVQQCAKY